MDGVSKTLMWNDPLPFTLWEYYTMNQIPTHVTPFSLVYGAEVVVPLK